MKVTEAEFEQGFIRMCDEYETRRSRTGQRPVYL